MPRNPVVLDYRGIFTLILIRKNCNMDEKKGISGSELVKLSDNPLFAMSLGGKELFHSNFLFWLLSTSSLKKATKELREWLFGEKQSIFYGENENGAILIYCFNINAKTLWSSGF